MSFALCRLLRGAAIIVLLLAYGAAADLDLSLPKCTSSVTSWSRKALAELKPLSKAAGTPPQTLQELLFFLHIPRTGGRTFHQCFLMMLYKEKMCPRSYDVLRLDIKNPNCSLLSTHDDYSIVSLVSPAVHTSVAVILRPPLSRVLSCYEFAVENAARVLRPGHRSGMWKTLGAANTPTAADTTTTTPAIDSTDPLAATTESFHSLGSLNSTLGRRKLAQREGPRSAATSAATPATTTTTTAANPAGATTTAAATPGAGSAPSDDPGPKPLNMALGRQRLDAGGAEGVETSGAVGGGLTDRKDAAGFRALLLKQRFAKDRLFGGRGGKQIRARTHTSDVWPWSELIPLVANSFEEKRVWAAASGGARGGRSPYESELVMTLREFVEHSEVTHVVHNGATVQLAGISNYSRDPVATLVRKCLVRYPDEIGHLVLQVAKERLRATVVVGLTEAHDDSAAMFMELHAKEVIAERERLRAQKSAEERAAFLASQQLALSLNQTTPDAAVAPGPDSVSERERVMEKYRTCVTAQRSRYKRRREASLRYLSSVAFSAEARALIPEALQQDILRRNQLDLELYEFGRELFEKQKRKVYQHLEGSASGEGEAGSSSGSGWTDGSVSGERAQAWPAAAARRSGLFWGWIQALGMVLISGLVGVTVARGCGVGGGMGGVVGSVKGQLRSFWAPASPVINGSTSRSRKDEAGVVIGGVVGGKQRRPIGS